MRKDESVIRQARLFCATIKTADIGCNDYKND
jgi:hypothetical protein